MNRSAGQANRLNSYEHRKKTLIPYIYNASNKKKISKILRGKLWIQNSHSNGHLTSF